jgi:hypothetical protein
MKYCTSLVLTLAVSLAAAGCTADVETTEDSHKIEVETPKVEVGDEPVDLDPRTDDDVDIDSPSPGDT